MTSIAESVSVITGGAGGLGFALARQFADRGAKLVLADLDEDRLARAADELRRRGADITTRKCNVSLFSDLEELREAALSAFGRVNIIVNNAGITHYGTFEEFSLEEVRQLFDVNLMGVIHGTRAFLPELRRSGDGHIVNMSSMASISGIPRQSTYCASKAAVRALSESLAAELVDTPVDVTWMIAGAIGTDIVSNAASKNNQTTRRLGRLLKSYGMNVDHAASAIARAVEKNRGEVRLTLDCEAYYQFNRLAPRSLRGAMALLHRTATRFEPGEEKP